MDIFHVVIYDFLKFVGGLWAIKWAWQILFGLTLQVYPNAPKSMKPLFVEDKIFLLQMKKVLNLINDK